MSPTSHAKDSARSASLLRAGPACVVTMVVALSVSVEESEDSTNVLGWAVSPVWASGWLSEPPQAPNTIAVAKAKNPMIQSLGHREMRPASFLGSICSKWFIFASEAQFLTVNLGSVAQSSEEYPVVERRSRWNKPASQPGFRTPSPSLQGEKRASRAFLLSCESGLWCQYCGLMGRLPAASHAAVPRPTHDARTDIRSSPVVTTGPSSNRFPPEGPQTVPNSYSITLGPNPYDAKHS